jgi:succinate dehydrogenase flavin-adding protein (antitoxin of CptAB toxin-antitoxin module)
LTSNKHIAKCVKDAKSIQIVSNGIQQSIQISSFNGKDANKIYCKKSEFEIFTCEFCGTEFKHKNNMYRHQKYRCIINLKNLTAKVQHLEEEISNSKDKHYKTKIDMLEREKDIYKIENEYHKTLTTNAGNVMGKTVSALTYIMSNYNTAPKLQLLDEATAMKLLTYETRDGKLLNPIVGKTPLQYLIDLYENNKLTQHLGNIIISQYKKLKPEDQSMWNTDPSRETFVIRDSQKIESNKTGLIWENDKRGIKINDYIIKPLLGQIKKMIADYDRETYNKFDEMTDDQRDIYACNSKYTIKIKEDIGTCSLNKYLLKYISPYFYMSKCVRYM